MKISIDVTIRDGLQYHFFYESEYDNNGYVYGCEIHCPTEQRWAIPHVVGRAYLGRVDSEPEVNPAYINELLAELQREAEEDMRLLFKALSIALAEGE